MKQNNIKWLYTLVEAENYSETRELLMKLLKGNKPLAVKFAIKCAYLCLDMFEKKNPADKWPRLAIEAAEAWIANPTAENEKKAKDATNGATAYAPAYAAVSATYAPAYAAYAAQSAAYAGAYATKKKATWTKCVDIYANLSRKEKLSRFVP